jgi:hypothetical protein
VILNTLPLALYVDGPSYLLNDVGRFVKTYAVDVNTPRTAERAYSPSWAIRLIIILIIIYSPSWQNRSHVINHHPLFTWIRRFLSPEGSTALLREGCPRCRRPPPRQPSPCRPPPLPRCRCYVCQRCRGHWLCRRRRGGGGVGIRGVRVQPDGGRRGQQGAPATQHNPIQLKTIQFNTIHSNSIQYNTTQFNTIRFTRIEYGPLAS